MTRREIRRGMWRRRVRGRGGADQHAWAFLWDALCSSRPAQGSSCVAGPCSRPSSDIYIRFSLVGSIEA